MNILIAIDSFKGSVSSKDAADAIEKGIRKLENNNNYFNIIKKPIGDGGEGTIQSLVDATHGNLININAKDPLFRNIKAMYGISGDKKTAFIEMAEVSGLPLLTLEERNPLYTSTYGTGELIRDAVDRGVTEIIVGIGGSATNDAGIGVLSALGYIFLDEKGNILKPIGKNLIKIKTIDDKHVDSKLENIHFKIACDVNNTFYGENGAAHIYGPQKGATEDIVK